MKVILLTFTLLTSVVVHAEKISELIGVGSCNGVEVDDRYTRIQYLVNATGQIKMDLEMENSFNSDSIQYATDSVRTPVISSLQAQGNVIAHLPSSVICAKFKKPALIGGKDWVGSSACRIKTVETKEKTVDQDGFNTGISCTRHYYLEIKI